MCHLHVASHTSNRPLDHGMMDILSGLLPSSRDRPVGSSLGGIFAETSDRWMMSFISPCRECLPWLHLQLRPWVANWSTCSPQCAQMCGRLKGHQSLRPIAILHVSSSICRPRVEIGKAFSHAPDSFVETASRQALDLVSLQGRI